VRNFSII